MNWFYSNNGQQRGPISEAEFEKLVATGTIGLDTLVWRHGMAEWQPLRAVRPPVADGSQPPVLGTAPLVDDAQLLTNALRAVNGPAIGLIVTAALGFFVTLASLGQMIMGAGGFELPPEIDPQIAQLFQGSSGVMAWFQILVGVALSSVVLAGGLKVMKLRNHGFCVTAAIIALLPCFSPCCCLGIPFGIWALVVINRPEVRSQFR